MFCYLLLLGAASGARALQPSFVRCETTKCAACRGCIVIISKRAQPLVVTTGTV